VLLPRPRSADNRHRMSKETKESLPSELSDQAGSVEAVEVNEKALLRKLDAKLLPAVGILYLLSFLDRSNGTKHLASHEPHQYG